MPRVDTAIRQTVAIMYQHMNTFLFGDSRKNTITQNLGFLFLRFFVGLALCTVFEKCLPRNGMWGPQVWFIQDTANMGFPFPTFFAWVAVLSEFFGGILLMLGLFTRPAALLNVGVTFTATFVYHQGDIGDSGLLSFFFLIMCTCIALFGPGAFSLDHLLKRRRIRSLGRVSMLILLFGSGSFMVGQAKNDPISPQAEEVSADSSFIPFYVQNKSLLPKKVTFIIYQPQRAGNNTRVKWMLPFQKVKFALPAKSKMYIATEAQVDTVMQGKRIDDAPPFVQVAEDLRGTIVRLCKRK